MAVNDSGNLRMLIQQVGIEPAYRVTVYGDLEKPRHADFNTAQLLLEALHAVLPEFDTSTLSLTPIQTGQGSIVFAGEVMLDKQQLGLLGLI